jgi:hypothetical protein
MNEDTRSGGRPWYREPTKLAFLGLLAIAAYFLIAEHWAHVVPWLPWLFLIACPLLHIFMHRGHGGHGSHGSHGGHGGHAGHGPERSQQTETKSKTFEPPSPGSAITAEGDAPGKDRSPGGNRA